MQLDRAPTSEELLGRLPKEPAMTFARKQPPTRTTEVLPHLAHELPKLYQENKPAIHER